MGWKLADLCPKCSGHWTGRGPGHWKCSNCGFEKIDGKDMAKPRPPQRFITYDALLAENQKLKTDLANIMAKFVESQKALQKLSQQAPAKMYPDMVVPNDKADKKPALAGKGK